MDRRHGRSAIRLCAQLEIKFHILMHSSALSVKSISCRKSLQHRGLNCFCSRLRYLEPPSNPDIAKSRETATLPLLQDLCHSPGSLNLRLPENCPHYRAIYITGNGILSCERVHAGSVEADIVSGTADVSATPILPTAILFAYGTIVLAVRRQFCHARLGKERSIIFARLESLST